MNFQLSVKIIYTYIYNIWYILWYIIVTNHFNHLNPKTLEIKKL